MLGVQNMTIHMIIMNLGSFNNSLQTTLVIYHDMVRRKCRYAKDVKVVMDHFKPPSKHFLRRTDNLQDFHTDINCKKPSVN
jgi:hypothetical protein